MTNQHMRFKPENNIYIYIYREREREINKGLLNSFLRNH